MKTSPMISRRSLTPSWAICIVACVLGLPTAALAEPLKFEAFNRDLLPFVNRHCAKCHNDKEAEGEVNLARFTKPEQLLAERKLWQKVVKQLKAGAMPPEGERKLQPAKRRKSLRKRLRSTNPRRNSSAPTLSGNSE